MSFIVRHLAGRIVGSHVFAVHVGHGVRLYHGVVKSRIEYLFLHFRTFHFDLS